MTNELKHYGVLGMKWGVRKAAKKQLRSAKRTRDAGLDNAKNRHDRSAARSKYKQAKQNINQIKNKKLAEIEMGRSTASKVGKKVATGFLVAAGATAVYRYGIYRTLSEFANMLG